MTKKGDIAYICERVNEGDDEKGMAPEGRTPFTTLQKIGKSS